MRILKTSSDDTMWLLPCSAEDLPNLIQDPYAWLDKQNAAAKAKAPAGTTPELKVLADYFVISLGVSRNPAAPNSVVKDDEYSVEGINGTPVITIRPRVNIGVHPAEEEWDSYWDEWSDDAKTPIKIQTEPDAGLGYSHFELSNPEDTPELRAKKVAAFLIYAGDPRRKWTPKGAEGLVPEQVAYINRIHKKVPHTVNSIVGGATKPPFKELADDEIWRINFLYTGTKNDIHVHQQVMSALPMDSQTPTACDNHIGTTDSSGQITSTDVIIKLYPPPTGG